MSLKVVLFVVLLAVILAANISDGRQYIVPYPYIAQSEGQAVAKEFQAELVENTKSDKTQFHTFDVYNPVEEPRFETFLRDRGIYYKVVSNA